MRIDGMSIRFSKWYAWTKRKDIPEIDESGVYVIARDVEPDSRPDLCSRKIIYVGCTEKLRNRLNAFDRSSKGGKGHAGGNSFFAKYTCRGLAKKINQLCREKSLNRRDAAKKARSELNCEIRMDEFEETWKRKRRALSVAVWVPTARWKGYPELSEREQLEFVEAKLLVDFVRKNKELPELNRTF